MSSTYNGVEIFMKIYTDQPNSFQGFVAADTYKTFIVPLIFYLLQHRRASYLFNEDTVKEKPVSKVFASLAMESVVIRFLPL